VKTTIDIPEPLYRKVKMQAVHRGISLRELVLGALEKNLRPAQLRPAGARHFEIDALGVPCLRRPAADDTVVNDEFLAQLREQEAVTRPASPRSTPRKDALEPRHSDVRWDRGFVAAVRFEYRGRALTPVDFPPKRSA